VINPLGPLSEFSQERVNVFKTYSYSNPVIYVSPFQKSAVCSEQTLYFLCLK